MILEHIDKAIPRACYTLIVFTLIKTSIWANNLRVKKLFRRNR